MKYVNWFFLLVGYLTVGRYIVGSLMMLWSEFRWWWHRPKGRA